MDYQVELPVDKKGCHLIIILDSVLPVGYHNKKQWTVVILAGHFARNCLLKGLGAPPEFRGRATYIGTALLPTSMKSQPQPYIPMFRKKLLIYTANFKVREVLAKVSISNHALQKDAAVLNEDRNNALLGQN